MKLTIDNKEYELDVLKAIDFGALVEARKEITDIKVGDVFETDSSAPVVILQYGWSDQDQPAKYCMGGNNGNSLDLFSDRPDTKENILEWLNEANGKFIKNVNVPLDI